MEANYIDCCNVPPCWNLKGVHEKDVNGKGITIAVLDSAINRNHTAFANTTLSGKNFINGKREDYWFSNREAHGTMVTGVVAKYAPKAEIYVCCVSEENKFKPKAIIKALEHLKNSYDDERDLSDKKKCQVIVMSFGHYKEKEDTKREELINDLASKGVICVAAIGNYGVYANSLAYPALLDQVIAVGGLTKFGNEPAEFNPPGKIDVYAPGEAVYAPVDNHNSKYREVHGTSFAAPAIGGIVALLMQCAHGNGDVIINSVELVKTIFSHMITVEQTTMPDGKEKNVEVFNPAYFFGEYDTPYKFSEFFQGCK